MTVLVYFQGPNGMAALTKNLAALKVLRGLSRELRLIYKDGSLSQQRIYNFIRDQFRRNEVTTQQVCRGEQEALHLGRSYLCYLESVRKHQELVDSFKGHGEVSTSEAAKMVGLNLPETKDL